MRKWFLIGIVTAFFCATILLWLVPEVIRQMPGRYRYYLPSDLVAAVMTPLPTSLPTVMPQDEVDLALLLVTATPTAVLPTATPTTAVSPTPRSDTTPLPATSTPTPLPTLTPTPTPDPLPMSAQLENLTIVPQKFNNCGPTNLTMSLNYYGHETDQFAVAAQIRPHYEDRNVSPWELVAYVEAETELNAIAFSGGSLRMLKELLALGVPVIVEKGLQEEGEEWLGHYLTLSGYDEGGGYFYTLDTLLGPWEGAGEPLPYDELLPFWQQFNYTLVAVYRVEQETAVSNILSSATPITMWQNAMQQAQNDIAAEPQNSFAWFNLGTSLARLAAATNEAELWENAAVAFDQARALGLPPRMLWYQFQPYVAYLQNGRYDDVLTLAEATLVSQGGRHVEETYYYQGLALQATGDNDGARLAFKRATQIHPNFLPAQEALAALD